MRLLKPATVHILNLALFFPVYFLPKVTHTLIIEEAYLSLPVVVYHHETCGQFTALLRFYTATALGFLNLSFPINAKTRAT